MFDFLKQFMGRGKDPHSVHQFQLKTLEGNPFPLSDLRSKKLLIVNVASACGLTPQYAGLEKLHADHMDRLTVLAVPCNDFAQQEPGTPEEIRAFCTTEYSITFPITEKMNIKSEPIHPLYQFLTQKDLNRLQDSEVEWNFQKYLCDERGRLIKVFSPPTNPLSEELLNCL